MIEQEPPRGLRENLEYRKRMLLWCRGNEANQALVRAKCADDVLWYINGWVWQYNPRKKHPEQPVAPFLTWDFQEEAVRVLLECIETDEDLLIEKSREMGASWLCLIVMEWLWHFKPWMKFLCISRNEMAVEDDDPDSLFWKIDFMHRYQPKWLRPKMKRRKLYYGNEDNGSTITGQASTGRAGVGGRATAMFIDEFSQIKEDYEVLHRTSDTTGCRIFNGTHRGTGTAFHELSRRVDQKKLVMHWTQHPDKRPGLYRFDKDSGQVVVLDKKFSFPPTFEYVLAESPTGGPYPGLRSPWYDRECGRKGSARAVAMDLDIDAGGSLSQVFDPLLIRTLRSQYACPPFWEGHLSFDQDLAQPLGLVKAEKGPLKLWVHQKPDGSMPLGSYVAGCDVSTGLGATNSCLSLVDCATGEKIGEYADSHIMPETMATMAVALCRLFVDERGLGAKLVWEVPGPGQLFGTRVMNLEYGNIFYREANAGTAWSKPSETPGWAAGAESKRILLDEYRAALDSRSFCNRSDEALEECLYFHYTPNGSMEHSGEASRKDPTGARVNHGDRVIADALAWKLAKGLGKPSRKRLENEIRVGTLAWRRAIHENRARQEQLR